MQVEVTDADREAAARLIALWDDGDLHCDDFTEAFARHRIAERERVVGEIVADLRDQWERGEIVSGDELADLIEAKFGGRDASA